MAALEFSSFTSRDALALAQRMIASCDAQRIALGLEIRLCGRTVFLYLPDELSADKVDWLKRKSNSVLYFGLSTKELFDKCKGDESLLVTKYARELSDFTLIPGGIPLRVKGCGIVGCVTVTGQPPEIDHRFVMEEVSAYHAIKERA